MKNLKTITAGCIFLLVSGNAIAQKYHHLKGSEKISGQQAYILPKASFVIEIPVVKTTLKKGDNFRSGFDEAMLKSLEEKYGVDPELYSSLDKLPSPKKEIITTEIANDSIKVSVVAVPDFDKVFYVNTKSKWNKKQTVTFTYGVDGILTDGESNIENRTFDIIVKAAAGFSSIAAPFVRDASGAKSMTSVDSMYAELDDALAAFKKLNDQINFDVYKDMRAGFEKKYMQVFEKYFYKQKKKITITKVVYTPGNSTALSVDIPLFMKNDDGDVSFSKKIACQLEGRDITTGLLTSPYRIMFTPVIDQQKDHYENRTDDKTGLAFNIPLKTEVKIVTDKNKTAFRDIFKIPQFGIVGFTDTRKEKLTFSLDPTTGELKKLSIEGKAITTDQVGATTSALTEAIKTTKGDDADTKLDKEVKRLENEKKKRALIKELEN